MVGRKSLNIKHKVFDDWVILNIKKGYNLISAEKLCRGQCKNVKKGYIPVIHNSKPKLVKNVVNFNRSDLRCSGFLKRFYCSKNKNKTTLFQSRLVVSDNEIIYPVARINLPLSVQNCSNFNLTIMGNFYWNWFEPIHYVKIEKKFNININYSQNYLEECFMNNSKYLTENEDDSSMNSTEELQNLQDEPSININFDIFENILQNSYFLSDLLNTVDYDISGCLANCSNKGTCKLDINTARYTCFCFEHFSGIACEHDSRACSSSPCLHNSTCIDIFEKTVNDNLTSQAIHVKSNYRCNCTELYYGVHCEHKVDVCENQTCSNRGTCHDVNGVPLCKCVKYHSGNECEIESEELQNLSKITTFTSVIAIVVLVCFYLSCVLMDLHNCLIMKKRRRRQVKIAEHVPIKFIYIN
jgi:hypothetical protein